MPPPKREKGTDPATKSSASVASAEGVAVHSARMAPSPVSAKRERPSMRGAPEAFAVRIVKRCQPSASSPGTLVAPWPVQPGS